MRSSRAILLATLAATVLAAGCGEANFTDDEKRVIASLSLSALPPLPPNPSNRYADDPAAAALGEALFFDTGFSRDGTVSCATCHIPERQFQDDLPLARGIGTTARRTMPIAGTAYSPWQFWDGRKDSLWSQALGPLEDANEHGGDRTAFAHRMAARYRQSYEAVFGPLPDLGNLPRHAGPLGDDGVTQAWAEMADDERAAVDTVFANMGKAIEAFERTVLHAPTRFDRFADAIANGRQPEEGARLTPLEIEGLRLFIGRANCIDCHNGPRFTDDHFHNTGVPAAEGLPEDRGRAAAIEPVRKDPFNCLGRYSDAGGDCAELRFMLTDSHELERAYKTPSLRGAFSRPPYMHAGQLTTLADVIEHYSTAPEPPSGHSQIEPFSLNDRGREALAAFLGTLEDD